MHVRSAAALVAVACLTAALPAAGARANPVEEARLGILQHDMLNLGSHDKEAGADLEFEVQFRKSRALRFLGSPRVQATFAWNTAGDTNFGGVGLAWDKRWTDHWYGEVQFGLALHDGVVDLPPGPAGEELKRRRLILGSRELFRWSAAVGYRIDDRWNVALEWVHLSNGDVLGDGLNEGIDAAGIRVGRRFR
jgi:lipid A 3-O-deacylase